MMTFKQFCEAIGIKRFYGFPSLNSILDSIGWTMIGNGAFASVWKVPGKPNCVYKAWAYDEAYEDFVKFCLKRENRNNPHLPKFLGGIKRIPAVFKRSRKEMIIKVIRMEELEKITMRDWNVWISDACRYYYEDTYDTMDDQAKAFRETVAAIRKDLLGGKNDIDIHPANIMMRPDGTVVITDPIIDEHDLMNNSMGDLEHEPNKYNKPYYLEDDKIIEPEIELRDPSIHKTTDW